jgi:hypothetical protein
MCDLSQLTIFLSAAAALVAVAIAAIVVAAILNNGFFSAPGSPAFMVAAGVSTLLAVAALKNAYNLAAACSTPACGGALSNLLNVLAALITVLGIQAVACFAAAGIAWIPWAGQVPMYVILGSLISQAILIPSAIAFAVAFVDCVKTATTSSSSSPLVAAVGVIVVALIAGVTRYFVAIGARR